MNKALMKDQDRFKHLEALQFLVTASPVMIYTCRAEVDYGATFISDNVTALLGYEPCEFTEEQGFWAKHIHPDDAPRVFAGLPRLFEQGIYRHEYRFLAKDGAYRWMSDEMRLVRDEAGRPREIAGYWVDITERKQVEESLCESQRSLAILIGSLPGMAYRCLNDPDWTTEFVSEGCLELTGYHPADLIGNRKVSFGSLIHPDDRDNAWNTVQTALREKRPYKLVYRIIAAGGEEKWVWEQGCGIFSSAGDVMALEGFVLDITERKKAEEEIKTINEELLAINRIVGLCSSTLNSKEILDKVLDEGLHNTGLEGGTICLLGTDQGLQLAAHRATSEATIQDLAENIINVGECLCG